MELGLLVDFVNWLGLNPGFPGKCFRVPVNIKNCWWILKFKDK